MKIYTISVLFILILSGCKDDFSCSRGDVHACDNLHFPPVDDDPIKFGRPQNMLLNAPKHPGYYHN